MSIEDHNVIEAKKALKHHIKFFTTLLKHLNGNDPDYKNRAVWVTWFLHKYINTGLALDMEKALKEQMEGAHENN